MRERITKLKDDVTNFWGSRTKNQKLMLIGSSAFVVLLLIGLSFFTFNTKYVPLYNNLAVNEVGQIKEELETRGVPYELEDAGTTILVPEDKVDGLVVDLAAQGIPASGNIDYSFFSENASWGITDNEFNIMKLDAMQTELANLIKGIDGISDAKVMINMPTESVFVSEETETGSASVVLHTDPGYQFKGNQINALYHLVSKAVPNLPEENIVITNQYFEYFDRDGHTASGDHGDYTYQQSVKKEIERDIQRRLQQMLGAMVGMDSVIVSATADVDFTQENRVEELADPVDVENMEGIPISIETIHETYTGNQAAGGVPGTGEEDVVPGYDAAVIGDDGEYELVKETINNEINRVRKDIVESPYKVRDLGIQVAVNNMKMTEDDGLQLLNQQEQNSVEEAITSILNSIITTSIDKNYGEINPDEKISIVFQEFTDHPGVGETGPAIPLWMYIVGAILILLIIGLIIMLIRSRKETDEEMETEDLVVATEEVPDMERLDSDSEVRRKQLEKMAEDNPEDFAKLLRSWIGED